MSPEAATAEATAAETPAADQKTDVPTKGEYDDLPDPLVEAGITPAAEDKDTPDQDTDATGDGSSEEDAGALELSPRQQQAAEHLHLSADDLQAQVEALGAEKVLAMLDAVAPEEGAGNDEEEDETGADEGEEFHFDEDLRGSYPDDADLLDALEGSVNGLRADLSQQLADLRTFQFSMAARAAIQQAGDVAKDLTAETVLQKADQLAGASALQGKRLGLDEAIQQAMQTLTSGNATAAARADLKKTVSGRAKQMTGAPAGRTKPTPTGAAAQKQQALDAIEQARIEAGLPPS